MKLAHQISLDHELDPDRAKFLKKIQSKMGNLTIISDLESSEKQSLKALGVQQVTDKTLTDAGYNKVVSDRGGNDLWWNDQKKTGLVYIGGGDFGQWVLKEDENVLKLLTSFLFEGWRKSSAGFTTDMSEISGHSKISQSAVRCPSCRNPLNLKQAIIDKNATHDGEGELLQWKFKCTNCQSSLTVFND